MGRWYYVAPPQACERLGDILARHGGDELEPGLIARLPGGRVFGPGIVLAPDGRTLARDVSTDFGKPFERHWLLGYGRMRPPMRLEGSTAVAAVTLGGGYCHGLLEELPRLLMLARAGERLKRAPGAVIVHTRARFMREAFDLGGFSPRPIEAGRYSHFECEELIVPRLIDEPGHPTARAVGLLNGFVAPLRERSARFGGRVYVSRERAGRRRVSNEPELWRRLEREGFVKLHLEEMSWAEQINAFGHAKVIVAPHGAGLANLAFCAPGARVVELFNRAYFNPCFERLAGVVGLEYRAVVAAEGESTDGGGQPHREDIEADVAAAMEALIIQ